MRPKNFPERKNRRRKAALNRLERQIESYRTPPRFMTDQADTLAMRITPSARDVRTKKYRGPDPVRAHSSAT